MTAVVSLGFGCDTDTADVAHNQRTSPSSSLAFDDDSPVDTAQSDESCNLQGVPLPVEVQWVGLEDAADVATATDGQVGISITSIVDRPTLVELSVVISADADRLETTLPPIELAAGASTTTYLDLASLGLLDAELEYSGLLRLRGTALDDGRLRHLTPPEAYFHPDLQSSSVLVYREGALQEQFDAGILGGSADFGVDGDPTVARVGVGVVVEGEFTDEDPELSESEPSMEGV